MFRTSESISRWNVSFFSILSGCSEMFSSIRDGVGAEKTQGSKPFGFARFENISEGNVQIASVVDEPRTNLDDGEAGSADPPGGRFENPLYRSKRRGRKEDEEILNMEAPLSLSTLKDKVGRQIEEVDVDIDEWTPHEWNFANYPFFFFFFIDSERKVNIRKSREFVRHESLKDVEKMRRNRNDSVISEVW